MTTTEIERHQHAALPQSMRTAQKAILLPEVQEMMKQLAQYNLGVCMPHMHPEEGVFVDLPTNIVALERSTDFVASSDTDPLAVLPVAWKWADNGVKVTNCCGYGNGAVGGCK